MKKKRTDEERLRYQREYYYKNKEVLKHKHDKIKTELQVVKDQFRKEKEEVIALVKQIRIEDNKELIRDGHNMMMNLLANTTTNIDTDDSDQDFLFYKVGLDSLIHELMLDVIEMEKSGTLNAVDVILRLHNIELINNAHLFNEKDKILKSI